MELKDYTTEELREELNRRKLLAREQKAKEREQEERCRNCKHLIIDNRHIGGGCIIEQLYCGAKTWSTKRGRTYHYAVRRCDKCKFNLFEHK